MGRPKLHVGCKVSGCIREHKAFGYCNMHYLRTRNYGRTRLKTSDECFYEKYIPEPKSGCWLWTAASHHFGYGLIKRNNIQMPAHRLSWKLHRGPIPDGMCVLHKCDVPACVNPDHLFLGTLKDNTQDMMKKGRHKSFSGEQSPMAKLTWKEVGEIRELRNQGLTYPKIAEQYGVGLTCIQSICTHTTWRRR